MSIVIPIGSGKGGVGKTVFTANLGILLAASGKKTILIDLDLGGSNLHTCLGIKNRNTGISSLINKQENSLENLLFETEIDNLFFIPGDTLSPGTGNLPFFTKQKIIKQINSLDADFILLDLGAGSTYNTVDFFLVSPYGIVFTSPETTSVLNAYSFIKTSVFRMLFRSFKAKSFEREIIHNFVNTKLEGSGRSFTADLIQELTAHSYLSGQAAAEKIKEFHPWVIVNRVENSESIELGLKLKDVTRKNIGIDLEFLGPLPEDKDVQLSIFRRSPVVLTSPSCPFTRELSVIADKLASGEVLPQPKLYLDEDDLLKIDE
ncbi:MAG: AAA family ATPase [Spirochaetales bacterium]|uniref:AAA family ATPase n=1 Tax=Candidatus Thalassospirochaeta sargassi TaxID=3119039 RepID=A0AAJ1ID54_9SPIO|nr:AAA family ATPase [Spirochaetales bacterium]